MSFFARAAGRGTRPRKSLDPKSNTRGWVVKGVRGLRIGYDIRLPAAGAAAGLPDSAKWSE